MSPLEHHHPHEHSYKKRWDPLRSSHLWTFIHSLKGNRVHGESFLDEENEELEGRKEALLALDKLSSSFESNNPYECQCWMKNNQILLRKRQFPSEFLQPRTEKPKKYNKVRVLMGKRGGPLPSFSSPNQEINFAHYDEVL
ncbi:unnamed protein product [Lepeophtheirus salmonis]|uniref:(salmon louse) hypothetical protein n=1 Tax=Lepeophtheirus salmonis TaxID=72036 RepID=A0A7R8CV23_LEPSM|nr:unnamed protein product [Lepeophtheirus salmonis]CAF2939968.1 unnamed protein product [Lepeophtheirus salmonis]